MQQEKLGYVRLYQRFYLIWNKKNRSGYRSKYFKLFKFEKRVLLNEISRLVKNNDVKSGVEQLVNAYKLLEKIIRLTEKLIS